MSKSKFACVWIVIILTFLCITTAFANIDTQTASIVSKLQGQWYDENGNVALDFEGNTVNGCPIVGAYHPAGGSGDFSCTLRIIENESYKDLFLICSHVGKPDYHSHIILNGAYGDASKGAMLLKTKTAQYYETVGGIGIDMPVKEVIAKYGEPDGLNEMLVSGQRTVTAYWFTGAKNGSAVLTFTNGRLTSKSQSNLE